MRRLNLLFGLVLIGVASSEQSQPAQKLSFEVASVKPLDARPTRQEDIKLGCRGTDSRSPGITIPSGRCIARFEPLRLVIALAYDIPPSHLIPYEGKVLAGPDWINNAMYDIEGKAEGAATMAELRLMLQDLLAERFKLKLRREK